MDDILVFGETEQERDSRLEQVLRRLKDSGLTLNKEKCQSKVTSFEFLEHTVTSEGISASSGKVKAVTEMKTPTNSKELKRLLGMVNHMRKFNPKLAEVDSPMRKFLKQKYSWL